MIKNDEKTHKLHFIKFTPLKMNGWFTERIHPMEKSSEPNLEFIPPLKSSKSEHFPGCRKTHPRTLPPYHGDMDSIKSWDTSLIGSLSHYL